MAGWVTRLFHGDIRTSQSEMAQIASTGIPSAQTVAHFTQQVNVAALLSNLGVEAEGGSPVPTRMFQLGQPLHRGHL